MMNECDTAMPLKLYVANTLLEAFETRGRPRKVVMVSYFYTIVSIWSVCIDSPPLLLPRAHAQRGQVIGSVVVVVSTKIARYRHLGVIARANCC